MATGYWILIVIHPHPSCSFCSSFTIRSRFFAVFMKVGR